MSPNIGKALRWSYVAIGIVLLLVPFVDAGLDTWIRIGAPILGFMAIVTGMTGW